MNRTSKLVAPLVAVIALALSGNVFAADTLADSWITTKIKATYAYLRWIDGSDIMVDTIEGVVTLSGSTDTPAERELAIELAQNIRGVKQVDASGLKAG